LNKQDKLDKLAKLRDSIHGWAYRETAGRSRKHESVIREMIRSDIKYIEKLINGVTTNTAVKQNQMTSEDMKKCNKLNTKYRAISNIKLTFKND
tara:strand:+ start:217 stop:498 length:282 start_codon:yes stop_codon:yes gene_type:complete